MTTKVCTQCGQTLPFDLFYKQRDCRSGVATECKKCHNRRSLEWARANPDASHQHDHKFKLARYGLSPLDFAVLFTQQDGRCLICLQPETRTRRNGEVAKLSVDHDHETGRVRGLLCQTCNQALGKFRDDPDILERAARYIRNHISEALKLPEPSHRTTLAGA